MFKVNPPLRTDSDVTAVIEGLCDGTIDAVATDHAPHAPESKDVPFDQAPPGMLGLQTALPIAWQVLSPTLGPERIFALIERDAGRDRPADPDRPAPGRPQCARRAARGRGDGQRLCLRPVGDDRRRPVASGQSQPEHALCRPELHRRGAPHDLAGRAGRHRRRGATMSGQRSGRPPFW